MGMKKKNKAYLIFSIVYWLLIAMSLILFGFAFGKVRINKYGILRNYYNSWIDNQTYISGLYHIGIGCYFIQFPSNKVYLIDQKLNVTNSDLNQMQITYTLVYRIIKSQVYNLYNKYSTFYQDRIISTINRVISNHFMKVSQQDSRVMQQPQLVNKIGSLILQNAIQIQAFWLNQIDFLNLQSSYEKAYLQAGTYSQAYEAMEIQKMKTGMELQIIKNLIADARNRLNLTSNVALRNATLTAQNASQIQIAQKKVLLSNRFNVSQIFQYYQPPKIVFN